MLWDAVVAVAALYLRNIGVVLRCAYLSDSSRTARNSNIRTCPHHTHTWCLLADPAYDEDTLPRTPCIQST